MHRWTHKACQLDIHRIVRVVLLSAYTFMVLIRRTSRWSAFQIHFSLIRITRLNVNSVRIVKNSVITNRIDAWLFSKIWNIPFQIFPPVFFMIQRSCWFRHGIMKMVWCRLMYVILGPFIIVCESCDSFDFIKWERNYPVYHEMKAPGVASTSLFTCSRWCMDRSSCMLLSWSPGSCWQVGPCGTLNVTGTVYDLKKDAVNGRCSNLVLWYVQWNWFGRSTRKQIIKPIIMENC